MKPWPLFAVLIVGCAPKTIVTDRSEMLELINRSSARIVGKRNADDGKRAGGAVMFSAESESSIALALGENFCEGPVIVRSEELAATGETVGGAYVSGNFAVGGSQGVQAWLMKFDCNRAASEKDIAAYREKFAKPYSYRQSAGDTVLGALGL